MLAFLRKTAVSLFIPVSAILLIPLCLLRPRHPNNAYCAIRLYSGFGKRLFGLKVTVRGAETLPEKCIYAVNHQSNIDIFSVCNALPKRTVTLGKNTILYFPIFGLLYWLSGNLFINRGNARKSAKGLADVERKIHEKQISIWIFPEGTRNLGKGLLPYKTGAFRLAAKAGIPIVPVCVNNYYRNFDMNRADNGEVIVEFQPAVDTAGVRGQQAVRQLTDEVRSLMQARIAELDEEAWRPDAVNARR